MFFLINWIISILILFLIAYLFDFSLTGWIIGLLISFLLKEFVLTKIIIKLGNNLKDKLHHLQPFSNSNDLIIVFNFAINFG